MGSDVASQLFRDDCTSLGSLREDNKTSNHTCGLHGLDSSCAIKIGHLQASFTLSSEQKALFFI